MWNHLVERCKNTFLKLRWKLFFVFGILATLGVAVGGLLALSQTTERLNGEMQAGLAGMAHFLARAIDPERLDAVRSNSDPYYAELKQMLQAAQEEFNLSWIGVYRYNGRYFTAIVDGERAGNEFCCGFPIFNMPSELRSAWKGDVTPVSFSEDAYGLWLTAYAPVRTANGQVVGVIDVSRDAEVLNRVREQVKHNTLKNIGMVVAATLVICMFFASGLTSQLGRLTEGARMVSYGDLTVTIPASSKHDEIGELVQTFNGMTDQLRRNKEELERKIFELTLLFDISQKINYGSSTDEVLRMILDRFVQAMKAERGSILMFDEDRNYLTVSVAVGRNVEHMVKRVTIAPGEGVAGRVFQTMQPVIMNKVTEEDFKPFDDPIEFDVKSIMCLPLVLERRPIGVINLVNKNFGEFSTADHTLGITLASQVALTIEKSRLWELAVTDGLTRLFVHRYFQVNLEAEMKRSLRYKKNLSMILMDVDHFKKFNDTWGHQTGDKVLWHVAQILKASLRGPDIAARYGGEEMAVILPETDSAGAMLVAERIRKSVEEFEFPGPDHPLKVTISLGVASCPEHAGDRLDLIKKADEALYSCKHAGRNCSRVYVPNLPASPKHA